MIVLRYSDFERPTIKEHVAILDRPASPHVWWGWWKKSHEEYPKGLFNQLKGVVNERGEVAIGLLDRIGERYHSATCQDVAFLRGKNLPSPNERLTPAYYRHREFPAWFAFSSIRELSRDDWEKQFGRVPWGDETLFAAQRPLPTVEAEVYEVEVEGTSGLVVHISDLHFGSDHGFKETDPVTLTPTLIDRITGAVPGPPACLVVSGDLTTRGDPTGLMEGRLFVERLAERLNLPRKAVVIAPGNHDILIDDPLLTRDYKNEQPFRDQMTLFYGESVPNERIHDIRDSRGRHYILGVLNSSRPRYKETMDYGYVGRDRSSPLIGALRVLRSRPRGGVWSGLVLHHHLLTAAVVEEPDRKRPVSLALDAGELVSLAQQNSVDAIMHGHQHMPFVGEVRRIAEFSSQGISARRSRSVKVLGAGSAGVNQANDRIPQEMGANALSYYEPFYEGGGLKVSCVSYLPRRDPALSWSLVI